MTEQVKIDPNEDDWKLIFSLEEVEETVRRRLKSSELYKEEHRVLLHESDRFLWIGYRTTDDHVPINTTHFDLNIENGNCYLLWIEVEDEYRGLGHGSKLYEIVEQIASDLGCTEVWQTPSGEAYCGEIRMDYLLRRGWKESGVEVFKMVYSI